jgi:hypothetical protein
MSTSNKISRTQLKKAIGSSAHAEISRGTFEQNRDYCSKTESRIAGPWTLGEPPKKSKDGKKKTKTMEAVIALVRAGASDAELLEQHPGAAMQYLRNIRQVREIYMRKPRSWKTKVFWYWGTTGTGKSRLAWLMTRRKGWIAVDNKGQWFDTYCGEEDVIFDDLDRDDCPNRSLFLRLTDRYPMKVPVKGSYVEWSPRRIFITSNLAPDELYYNCPAVLRRITETFNLN